MVRDGVIPNSYIHFLSGTLSLVGGLRREIEGERNLRSINISWTAPFSLDVTGVDPDIWYSVLIYNVTDETACAVSVPYPNCTNISETFCVFTPDHLSPCHKYNVTVIPQNGAGVGESSYILTGAPGIGNNVCTQQADNILHD